MTEDLYVKKQPRDKNVMECALVSRGLRSTELRITEVCLDDTAREFVAGDPDGVIRVVAHRTEDRARKKKPHPFVAMKMNPFPLSGERQADEGCEGDNNAEHFESGRSFRQQDQRSHER